MEEEKKEKVYIRMSSDEFTGARGKSKSVNFKDANPFLPEEDLSIDENDVIRLAQRYYLSPNVVKEAKVVFDHYCALESKLQLERERMMMISRSSRKSRTLIDPAMLEKLGVGASPGESPDTVKTEGPGIAVEKVSQTPGDNSRSPRNRNSSSSLVDKNSFAVEGKKSSATSLTVEQQQEEEEKNKEVRLGAEGLQQFFLDLGMAISSLEVADLVHTLNDDPIDFVTQKRIIEAAAAQAAAEAAQMNSNTARKVKSPLRTTTNKKKGRVDGDGSISNDVFENPDKKFRSSSIRKKSSRDGVTFSLFLFILSNMLLEEEDNPIAKESEVSELFNLLDVDKDGSISLKDVKATIGRLVNEGVLGSDSDILHLCNMTNVELDTALMECDVDDDGSVTMEDLYNVLHS